MDTDVRLYSVPCSLSCTFRKATSVKKEESSKAKKDRRPISLDSGREMMCTYWGCPILFMLRVIERFYFHGNHDFNFFFGFIYNQNVIILNFMWTWKNYEYLSWCMKRPTIFMRLSSIKGFGGLSLLMECEGWIGKLFSVRWAWGKMRSVFLHHLTFNLTYTFACQRKQIHPLHPGFGTLTIRPLCLE